MIYFSVFYIPVVVVKIEKICQTRKIVFNLISNFVKKKLSSASYFQLSSQCLEMQSNMYSFIFDIFHLKFTSPLSCL